MSLNHLEELDVLTSQSDEEPESIQAKKEKPDKRRKGQHERTEAQKKAFEMVQAKRDAIRKERITQRLENESKLKEELQKKTEEKLLKKAVAIKKKHILQVAMIDDISDEEDIPIEIVKKIQQRQAKNSYQRNCNQL